MPFGVAVGWLTSFDKLQKTEMLLLENHIATQGICQPVDVSVGMNGFPFEEKTTSLGMAKRIKKHA